MRAVRGSEGDVGHVVPLNLNADGTFWKLANAALLDDGLGVHPSIQSDKALLLL